MQGSDFFVILVLQIVFILAVKGIFVYLGFISINNKYWIDLVNNNNTVACLYSHTVGQSPHSKQTLIYIAIVFPTGSPSFLNSVCPLNQVCLCLCGFWLDIDRHLGSCKYVPQSISFFACIFFLNSTPFFYCHFILLFLIIDPSFLLLCFVVVI